MCDVILSKDVIYDANFSTPNLVFPSNLFSKL